VAIVLIAVVSSAISGIGEPGHWSQQRQLSTFPRYPDYDPVFAIRPVWWHLAWLASLCAATAVVALLHDRRDRLVVTAGGITVVALLVTGIATSRPLDEKEAEQVASMVAHPERHQDCIERLDGSFCAYDGFEDLGRMIADEVEPVLAGLPGAAPDAIVMRQLFDERLEELDPEVRDRLPSTMPMTDADVNLGFSSHPDVFAASRISAGLWAVDLPAWARPGALVQVIAGEARGVIALWIAARGLAPGDAVELASAHPDPNAEDAPSAFVLGMAWPEPCEVGPAPVAWASQDLTAARALLALPEAEVRAGLDEDWAVLTDPDTTTAELMDRFGLPSVGPIDELQPEVWECTY
jgi:hypothetical protein